VQGSNVIRGNVDGLTSFFEVYGDLTLERDSVIDTAGVIFIIHGSLKITGTGAAPIIRTIGGDAPIGYGGGGSIGFGNFGGGSPDGGVGGAGAAKMLESPSGYNGGGSGGGGGGGVGYIDSGVTWRNNGSGGAPNGGNAVSTNLPASYGLNGSGGAGIAGQPGTRLFGGGESGTDGNNGTGDPTSRITNAQGGAGGNGGRSGGASIFIIVFGEIDPEIIFTLGNGFNNGITIVSNYASIPNTINNWKYIEYLTLNDRSDTNEHLLTEYGYFSAGSINI
jgi:hypothetical protein